MKLNKSLLALTAATSLVLSGQVMAAGTPSNTTITNSVTLNFQVNGADQAQLTNSSTFKVDNKINMTLVNNSTAAPIAPGVTETYTLRLANTGNKAQKFKLNIENVTASTDTNITIPGVTYAIQTDHATGASISGDELSLPLDGDVTYTAIFTFPTQNNTPVNIVDGETFNVLATATAITAAGGTIIPDEATDKNDGTNIDEELVVFAEGTSTDSLQYNGTITSLLTTTINTASLTNGSGGAGPGISVKVINDPLCEAALTYTDYSVGNTGSKVCPDFAGYTPKAIPGALIEYTITTVNSSTTTGANHLVYAHTLPASEATLGNIAVSVNGTLQTGTYVYDTVTYNVNNSTASGLQINIESLPATETAVITFTAIVQ